MMKLFFALCFPFFATAAWAQDLAPDVLVRQISNEVTEIVKKDKDIQAGNRKKVNDLVDAKLLPHFNFTHMTALALGRNWPKANAEQQNTLTNEFRALLVHTYSGALSTYRNQVIEFKPLRAAAQDADVTVKTQVRQPGTEPVSIDYSMEKTSAGWKVYDVTVGGVSLVSNYRETFNAEIRDGGVNGLIRSLAGKNRSLETSAGSKPK